MATRLLLISLLLTAPFRAAAYSVLTHESIIDSLWESHLKPLLMRTYPRTTPDELVEAHAYVYGGALIQDMGYYPFSNKLFSDLVHYVRTGDFVQNMIKDASNVDEYAFALGSLAHYLGDRNGHPIGVNPSVPLIYPKLARKFGPVMTYEQNKTAHLRTEFSFDVSMVAAGRYAPQSYHDFIGFKVSKPLLERAFQETYGIELKSVISNLDLALGTYRHTVGSVIPEMTRVAWQTKRKDIEKLSPGINRNKYIYRMSRRAYEKDFDATYTKPGFWARLMAFSFRVLPKIGPLKALAFRPPTPQAENNFLASVKATSEAYRAALEQLRQQPLQLPQLNLDTGAPVKPGAYSLANIAYVKLLDKVSSVDLTGVDPAVRSDILSYFSQWHGEGLDKRDKVDWNKVQAQLAALSATPAKPKSLVSSPGKYPSSPAR